MPPAARYSGARREHLGDWLTLRPTDAGIQFVGELRTGLDDRRSRRPPRRRGINVSPLSIHYRHAEPQSGLVMGYAATNETAMQHGFRLFQEALREASTGGAARRRSSEVQAGALTRRDAHDEPGVRSRPAPASGPSGPVRVGPSTRHSPDA